MTKEEFKTDYKIVYNSYIEKLLSFHNKAVNDMTLSAVIDYIGTFSLFLRDYYLVTTPEDDNSDETAEKVSAIMMMADEYLRYNQVKAETKKTTSKEEADKLEVQKLQHLVQFCQLLIANTEV